MSWEKWLRELEQLSPDAPDWQGADAFIERLLALRQEQQERLQRLTAAWTSVVTDFADELRYCQAGDLAATPNATAPFATLGLLDALRDGLQKLRDIRGLPEGNLEESRSRVQKLTEHNAELAAIIEQLRAARPVSAAVAAVPEMDADPNAVDRSAIHDNRVVLSVSVPAPPAERTDEAAVAATDTVEVQPDQRLEKTSAPENLPLRPVGHAAPSLPPAPPRAQPTSAFDRRKQKHERDKKLRERKTGQHPHVDQQQAKRHATLELIGLEMAKEMMRGSDPWLELNEPDESPTPSEIATVESAAKSPVSAEPPPVEAPPVEPPPVEAAEPPLAAVPPAVAIETEPDSGEAKEAEPSPVQAAIAPPATHASDQTELLCEWLRQGDFAAAYWWLSSRESAGMETALPAWLAAALHAAQQPAEALAAADELGQLASTHDPPDDPAAQLLAIAAALLPALTQTRADVKPWLVQVQATLPHVKKLAEAVREFAAHGQSLRPEDIGSRLSEEEAELAVVRVVAEMSDWLDRADDHKASFQRASRVWRHFVDTEGALARWMKIVADDRRGEVGTVEEACQIWSQRNYILRQIDALDSRLSGRKDPIDGKARDQIVTWTLEGCELADRWVGGLRRLDRQRTTHRWFDEQVLQLRGRVSETIPRAQSELQAIAAGGEPLLVAAGAVALRAVAALAEFFQLEIVADANGGALRPAVVHPQSAGGLRNRSAEKLAQRLLWLPEIKLADDGQPTDESLPRVAEALAAAARESRSIRTALDGWLAKRDFRFAETLAGLLDSSDPSGHASREWNDQRQAAQYELESRKSQLEQRIQDAVVDGVLGEVQRAECQQALLDLEVGEVGDFSAAEKTCDRIDATLQEARQEHSRMKADDWRRHGESWLALQPADVQRHFREQIEAALRRQDCRVANECMAQLEEAAERGRRLSLDEPASQGAELRDFLDRQDGILAAMQQQIGRELEIRPPLFPVSPGHLFSGAHWELAKQTWDAWRKLRAAPLAENDPRSKACFRVLCQFLDLELMPSETAIELHAARPTWAHVSIVASDRQTSPVPQFGSDRSQGYDLLCLWGDLSPQGVVGRVKEAGLAHRPALVLIFGLLSARQRDELSRELLQENLAMLVLDEVVLGWLFGQREPRWPRLLRAALPFAAVNPYKPSGVIPHEMFFGRKDMLKSLLEFSGSGSCLVFGGRQLGKSSLLCRARQLFHDPAKHQFAICEDIRNLGDPSNNEPAELIWTRLRNELNREFFDTKIKAEQPEALIDHIRNRLDQEPKTRLLILLDEADHFLNFDAAQNFQYVAELKKLMERSERRVKVVFAGTHNVQRFQGIPNQPFVNLSTALNIGPLEPSAARQLVQRPMQDVGYVFQDEPTVLRILSYTNYHPALIQAVCLELLKDLQSRPRNKRPPCKIQDDDVRQVCVRRETQQNIREKFLVTLQLDGRFKAILCAMIDEHFERGGNRTAVHPPANLLERVRLWWPAAFESMLLERFRDLLEELCGLGVLLRATGGYRFRSPNVIHLIGDADEIRGHLEELQYKPAPAVFRSDSHRVLLGKSGRRSPLTYAQSRQLGKPEFGTGLIFGSPAGGWNDLPLAIERFLPGDAMKAAVVQAVAAGPAEIADWSAWLREFIQQHHAAPHLIVLAQVAGTAARLEAMVRESVEFCRRREKSEKQWMRALLRFDPAATWTWLSLPLETRWELSDLTLVQERLVKWDAAILDVHLQHAGKVATPAVIDRLLSLTGGWPMLLDEVWRRCGEHHDPRPAADQVDHDLRRESPLRTAFRHGLGLSALPQSESLTAVFRQLGHGEFDADIWQLAVSEELSADAPHDALLEFLLLMQVIEGRGQQFQVNPQAAVVIAPP